MTHRLLEPLTLGREVAPNRIIFGPHETNLCRGRSFSDRSVAYYARRAEGLCGTIITETASVHPSDWPYERAPLAAECAEGWAAIVRAVQERHPASLVLASLGHSGGQGSSAYSQLPLWSPGRFPDPATREVPQEMEADDIAVVVAGYASAARTAVSAGVHGVEVNAGQLSLIRQFLSGLTNTRDDAFGIDRLLFPRQVLEAVREAVGGQAIVGLRLGCDELAPWIGITADAAPTMASALSADVDYVVAARAPAFDVAGTRPDGHTEEGFAVPLAVALRAALPAHVAVVAQGSIVDSDMAEEVLGTGGADLIEMTRAQIADPDLVNKLVQHRADQIRPCVLCNQRCQVRDARNPLVSCVGEPFSGYEGVEQVPPGRSAVSRQVVVVGAGPAGLEAARVAAARGHHVAVAESGARVGGLLVTASWGHGRGRLRRLADWQAAECHRLGVEVSTGTTVTPAEVDILLAQGTRVILCTGSRHVPSTSYGDATVDLRTAAEVLGLAEQGRLHELPEGRVVLSDPVGDAVGISVAELLAAAGREVTLVTGDLVAGVQLSRSGDLAPANARLARAGVRVVKGSRVSHVADHRAYVESQFTGEKSEISTGLVIEATFGQPEQSLWRDHPGLTLAGDAVAPRTVYEAVLEGRRAALGLEATS